MTDVRLLAWSSTIIIGTVFLGTSLHFFRCNNTDNFKYSDGSVLSYYCPIISATEAEQLLEKLDGQLHTTPRPQNPPIIQETLRMGKHDVYRDQITLSGFSSGGTFAQQMFIAHSSLFTGIASFSHAYYRCGPGNALQADYDNACTIVGTGPNANRTYNPDLALSDIRMYEQRGLIDRTSNLRNKKLYVYAGSRSEFFNLDQSLGAVRVFEPFIMDPCRIRTRVQDATQLLPTNRYGGRCTQPANENFFVGNCGFSGAYEALNFLIGDSIIQPTDRQRPRLSQLLTFDQEEFSYGFNNNEQAFMDTVGYIYVPRQCHRHRCFLHFYFHGCLTGREFNGTSHIERSGFLEVAEANSLIVVFPQAIGTGPRGENEIGCWDTYGLTGPLYATQQGAQVTVVRNMLARILGTDNELVPEPDSPRPNRREREPLGIEFEIVKGREVFLR